MREYHYRERQVGWGLLLGMFLSNAVALPVALYFDPGHEVGVHLIVWSTFAVLVLFLGSLTIEVDGRELRWSFGWLGWPGGRIALADISRIETGAYRWQDGWGIRSTPSGMLYNIAGSHTLRIVRQDGSSFRLGTADLRGLQAALSERVGTRR